MIVGIVRARRIARRCVSSIDPYLFFHRIIAKFKSQKESSDESCEPASLNALPVFEYFVCKNYRNDPSGSAAAETSSLFFDCLPCLPCRRNFADGCSLCSFCPKTPSKWRGGPQLPASTDKILVPFCRPTGLCLPS